MHIPSQRRQATWLPACCHLFSMRSSLLAAMRDRGGVITRADALRIVDRHIIDKALKAAAIVRTFPSTYVLADIASDVRTLDRAAVAYVRRGALSHIAALGVYGVVHESTDDRRHLTTAPGAQIRPTAGLVVHRRRGFMPEPPHVVVRCGLPVVRLEQAIVESWPLLTPGERRKTVITAVNSGFTTGARLLDALGSMHTPSGSAEMRQLFGLLRLGCRSELELWGHAEVFDESAWDPSACSTSCERRRGRSFWTAPIST